VEAIHDLRRVRPGDRAALRRSLAAPPGADPRVHPIVYPYLSGVPEPDEWRWFLVAGLMGLLPDDWKPPSEPVGFGISVRELKQKRDSKPAEGDKIGPTERRFVALLDADRDELPHHMRHMLRLIIGAEVRVDFTRLLTDLRWWSHPERRVQRRWARDFWAGTSNDEQKGDEK
jgi:CRISPR system Cascade subunit CasB